MPRKIPYTFSDISLSIFIRKKNRQPWKRYRFSDNAIWLYSVLERANNRRIRIVSFIIIAVMIRTNLNNITIAKLIHNVFMYIYNYLPTISSFHKFKMFHNQYGPRYMYVCTWFDFKSLKNRCHFRRYHKYRCMCIVYSPL